MSIEDIGKLQLKKVNPFQGLVIDADAWRDAHNYHANHMRVHLLAFHHIGIVEGLEVTANAVPDLSVNVQPGIAVDPEGNVIIVGQKQRYKLQTQKGGPVYLVIQFREVAGEPYQPPNGGQPTRMLDAYRIQERDKLPSEPYLELARLDFDPAKGAITDAKAPARPGKNEIDLRNRIVKPAAPAAAATPVFERQPAPQPTRPEPARIVEVPRAVETVLVGHAVPGGTTADGHAPGLQNLLRYAGQKSGLQYNLEDNIALDQDLARYTMIFISGSSRFELPANQQAALGKYLQDGGTVFGEGCTGIQEGANPKASRDFGLAYNQLAGQLKHRLESVKRGHSLLSAFHYFPEVPPGVENGMLMEGGHMIYSGSDYACAWQGGHPDKPLSREIIRAAFEMGENLLAYARMMKTGRS
jgi:hypothetical protein